MSELLCPLKRAGIQANPQVAHDFPPLREVKSSHMAACDREHCAWWVVAHEGPDHCAVQDLTCLGRLGQ